MRKVGKSRFVISLFLPHGFETCVCARKVGEARGRARHRCCGAGEQGVWWSQMEAICRRRTRGPC